MSLTRVCESCWLVADTWCVRALPVLELVVLGAARPAEEALGQLLQVAAVVHLDLGLLPEEVLQVLQHLHPQLTLLVQTAKLLHQLGPDLCGEGGRGGREVESLV